MRILENLILSSVYVFLYSDTNRTTTSKQSPLGHYPSSRDSPTHPAPFQDPYNRRSPTRDPHSRRSPTRDSHSHRSPTRDSHGHRSPTRDPYSHRSSTRDRQRHHHHEQQQQQQRYFPQIQAPSSSYDQVQAPVPIQYVSSIRLPLLRLGGPSITITPMFTQPRLLPPPPPPVYPSGPIYASTAPRPPLPMLHIATQLPPPASLSPQATRIDQQKLSYVQNMMHQYAGNNRPRLQLLHMRPHPRTDTTTDLHVPMPVRNVVTTSSDTKIDTGIQVEVPRQDGFIIEPGLFQVSFLFF